MKVETDSLAHVDPFKLLDRGLPSGKFGRMSNDGHPNRKRQAYRHETANEMGTPSQHMEGRFCAYTRLYHP